MDPDDWDPEYWFEILTYADGGDVEYETGRSTAANGARITGRYVRKTFGTAQCLLKWSTTGTKDRFLFTTYGYGHGGDEPEWSQSIRQRRLGLHRHSNHYYPGTEIG